MARTKNHGNGRLEEALVALTQAQASLVQNQATLLTRMSETDKENTARFARIEAILLQHSQILAEHTRILQALPEAVRQKIGFRPAEQPS